MSKIKDMLTSRREEVITQMTELEAELQEIEKALAAIQGSVREPEIGNLLQSAIQQRQSVERAATQQKKNIGQMTIEVLEKHPGGLSTREIAGEIAGTYARKITNRNMSWHLSRLKRHGILVLEGDRWRLLAEKNEAPDDEASSAPGSGVGGSATNR